MCVDQIGDLLINNIPTLKPHIRWCSRQLNACTLLQNKSTQSQPFREFEQQCMADPRTAGLPMSSFLLRPMQRVTKYPLLIERVRFYMFKGVCPRHMCFFNSASFNYSKEIHLGVFHYFVGVPIHVKLKLQFSSLLYF